MAAQQDQSAEPVTQAQAFIKRVGGRYYVRAGRDNGADPDLGPGDSTIGPPSFQHACGALLLETPSDDGVCGRIVIRHITDDNDLLYEPKLILDSSSGQASDGFFEFKIKRRVVSNSMEEPAWVQGSLKVKVAAATDAGGQEVLVGHYNVREAMIMDDGMDDGCGSASSTEPPRRIGAASSPSPSVR